MEPLLVAVPVGALQTVVFYRLHWAHRHLLPERFRSLLMAKGVAKSVTYLLLTAVAAWVSVGLGWAVAVGQPLLGAVFHVAWCRSHGIEPLTVQPREEYVLATTGWVEKLVECEERRDRGG